MLTLAPLESSRFGLRTFRATPEAVDTASLFGELCTKGADLAILRVRPEQAPAVRALDRFGLAPIHADTLVGYACNLEAIEPLPPAADGFTIESAGDGDRAAIGELVDTVFAEYPSHYTANPLLVRRDVVAGYREWALSHLSGGNRITWVARAGGRVAAIACSALDTGDGECQGVLHGVHPDFARGGIYTALIRHTQGYFRGLGCKRLTIQTQAWNIPVQRVWAREGFALAEVFETFHVNALLDPAHGVAGSAELRFADADGRDVAGSILRATLDAASGVEPAAHCAPGHRASVAVFAPIHAGKSHSLQVRSYDFQRSCGQRIVVGLLRDADGRLCALARVATGAVA